MLYNHFVSTIQNAKCMKSPAFDLRCICNCFSSSDEQIEHIVSCEERLEMIKKMLFDVIGNIGENGNIKLCNPNWNPEIFNAWVCVALNLLGSYVSESGEGLNVLVVGSGDARKLRIISEKNNIRATTIDPKGMFYCVDGHEIPKHKHISKEWENINRNDLELNSYDMIIIDVEPHRYESSIYSYFYKYLKPKHIVYCECILDMGVYIYCFFDTFFRFLSRHNLVIDYFTVTGYSRCHYFSNKDAWIFCDKKTTKHYDESQINIISKHLPPNKEFKVYNPFEEGVNLFLCEHHFYG